MAGSSVFHQEYRSESLWMPLVCIKTALKTRDVEDYCIKMYQSMSKLYKTLV